MSNRDQNTATKSKRCFVICLFFTIVWGRFMVSNYSQMATLGFRVDCNIFSGHLWNFPKIPISTFSTPFVCRKASQQIKQIWEYLLTIFISQHFGNPGMSNFEKLGIQKRLFFKRLFSKGTRSNNTWSIWQTLFHATELTRDIQRTPRFDAAAT